MPVQSLCVHSVSVSADNWVGNPLRNPELPRRRLIFIAIDRGNTAAAGPTMQGEGASHITVHGEFALHGPADELGRLCDRNDSTV